MKKFICMLFLAALLGLYAGVGNVIAFETEGPSALIGPKVDTDLIILQNKQSKTVTTELGFPFDFQIIPIVVIGKGTLSVSLSRTNTAGEIIYLYFKGFDDFEQASNIGLTPVTLRVSSTSGLYENNVGVLITGILFSLEDPPYEYSVSLSY